MHAGTIERIETNVERGAAAFFAVAVAVAAFAASQNIVPPRPSAAFAALALVLAYLGCGRVMAAVAPRRPAFQVQVFDVRELELPGTDELILTEADRVADELLLTDSDRFMDELLLTDADRLHAPATPEEPLLLEDVLPPADDSPVVRLFDRKAMPSPGQLKSRIDEHLASEKHKQPQSDASRALAEALAELRQSLRQSAITVSASIVTLVEPSSA